MAFLDRQRKRVVASLGTVADMKSNNTYADNQGELAVATDTNNLYVGNASYRFIPIQSLDLAGIDEDITIETDEDFTISFDND